MVYKTRHATAMHTQTCTQIRLPCAQTLNDLGHNTRIRFTIRTTNLPPRVEETRYILHRLKHCHCRPHMLQYVLPWRRGVGVSGDADNIAVGHGVYQAGQRVFYSKSKSPHHRRRFRVTKVLLDEIIRAIRPSGGCPSKFSGFDVRFPIDQGVKYPV